MSARGSNGWYWCSEVSFGALYSAFDIFIELLESRCSCLAHPERQLHHRSEKAGEALRLHECRRARRVLAGLETERMVSGEDVG